MKKVQSFRKRPIVIQAVQLRWTTWNAVCDFLGDIISEANPARMVETYSDTCGEVGPEYIELLIPTLHGPVTVQHGDWIIRGPAGDVWPCRVDIFEAMYEVVS